MEKLKSINDKPTCLFFCELKLVLKLKDITINIFVLTNGHMTMCNVKGVDCEMNLHIIINKPDCNFTVLVHCHLSHHHWFQQQQTAVYC